MPQTAENTPGKRDVRVVRGDIDKIIDPQGGTIFVEGNVNKVELNDHLFNDRIGIIYIRGNLKLLDTSANDVVIVAGKLKKFVQKNRGESAIYTYPIRPSPFIFTTHAVAVERVENGNLWEISPAAEIPMSPTFIVPASDLLKIKIQDIHEQVSRLCQQRLLSWAEDAKRKIIDLKTLEDMLFFIRHNLYGGIEMYAQGIAHGNTPKCDSSPC
jgi:hypothetical protein